LILHYTTQFKKDYKKVKKQNKNLLKLKAVIEKLVNQQTLKPKYKDHQLTGNWKGHRDCHIDLIGFLFIKLLIIH
jgi:mRNA interferase YafQ